jgi:hypothetical protein
MRLTHARRECHHAIQLNTHLARGFVRSQPDESHTTTAWLREMEALAGQPVIAKSGSLRLALRLARLAFALVDESAREMHTFALEGRSFEDARNWLAGQLKAVGIEPSPLWSPLQFELEDHPLAHGAPFSMRGHEAEFEELASFYGDAASILSGIAAANRRASPVRCWPHHFDIATLLTLEGSGETARTIGAGLSPGDGSYAQPYYYVTPWPYPERSRLPELTMGGFWHTSGWVGAVLLAEAHAPDAVRSFLDGAIAALISSANQEE